MPPLLLKWPSLSRSYRVILPSSFNVVLSYALVFSTIPPASVSSTVLFLFTFLALFNNIVNVTLRVATSLNRGRIKEYPLYPIFMELLRDRLFPSIGSLRCFDGAKPWIFGGTFSVLIATYASICNSDVN
jgi:hypothetical protein